MEELPKTIKPRKIKPSKLKTIKTRVFLVIEVFVTVRPYDCHHSWTSQCTNMNIANPVFQPITKFARFQLKLNKACRVVQIAILPLKSNQIKFVWDNLIVQINSNKFDFIWQHFGPIQIIWTISIAVQITLLLLKSNQIKSNEIKLIRYALIAQI